MPNVRVVDPERLGTAKDPDAYVRERGIDAFRSLLGEAECATTWRALDHARHVTPDSDRHERRAALAQAGEWLGKLPARLALEQEDAILAVSERCGYAPEAVERAFRARFWPAPESQRLSMRRSREPELGSGIEM